MFAKCFQAEPVDIIGENILKVGGGGGRGGGGSWNFAHLSRQAHKEPFLWRSSSLSSLS